MAGRKVDQPGRKFSVWISGENQQRLREQGLTPGEAVDRGLAAGDRVPVPRELAPTLALVARLAVALSNGARVEFPEDGEETA
jgi:hypothetical protein